MLKLLRKAPVRFRKSFGYCRDGLKDTFIKEESFRLETIALAVLVLILVPAPWPAWKKIALTAAYLLIPLAEIVNSAIENICDLVTTEHSALVKAAKDKACLAVLFAIVIDALVLAALLLVD